jgi:hypothetical protein
MVSQHRRNNTDAAETIVSLAPDFHHYATYAQYFGPNFKCMSTSQISSMHINQKLSDRSSRTVLLCEETAKSTSSTMKGDCLLFKNDKDDNSVR